MEATTPPISDQQKQQYQEEGYFILEAAIPAEHLQILRAECQYFIDRKNAEMDQEGKKVLGIRIVRIDTGQNGGFVTNVLLRTVLN